MCRELNALSDGPHVSEARESGQRKQEEQRLCSENEQSGRMDCLREEGSAESHRARITWGLPGTTRRMDFLLCGSQSE